jgi:hypothetical protein
MTLPLERSRTRAAERPSASPHASRFRAWWALCALVLVSSALRLWAALDVPSPWFVPDEMVYGELGKTLYREGHLDILGGPTAFYSLIYPAFVGLPLSFGHTGYVALKVVQAVVLSLTAVPVYVWARSLGARAWALVAAALTLTLPGLAFAGFVMSEVLFTPLVFLAAWAMARAIERPTLARQVLLLGAILLACATRLQAIVLVPVLVLAIALAAGFARTWLRGVQPFAPGLGGLALMAALLVLVKLLHGGSTLGSVLGAYQATTRTSYTFGGVSRFVLYHAADVLLLTALVPVVALALLAWDAARGRERDPGVRTYLAVALALAVGLVVQVGLFTSAFTDRLAERNVLGLAPVVFVGFAVWLARGLPRPRGATIALALSALVLLAVVPWHRLVTQAGEPDSFSVISLYHLHLSYPSFDTRWFLLIAAGELLVTLLVVPRTLAWLLPVSVAVLLAGASVETSRVVAHQARGYATVVGPHDDWIDRATSRPVAYLYSGEVRWSGGGPAWVTLFWNDRVKHVYDLFGSEVLGPVPQRRVHPAPDGTLLLSDGRPAPIRTVAASTTLVFFGRALTSEPEHDLALWRLDSPARLAGRLLGVDRQSMIYRRASLRVYDCTGFLRLGLLAPGPQQVTLWRNDVRYRTVTLQGGRLWSGAIPAPPGASGGRCSFAVEPQGPLHADRFEFVRPAAAN